MASPTQQISQRLIHDSSQETIRNTKLRKAMHELKELHTRLDLGVKNLEATWDPIDMAMFEEVNIEERSSDSGMSAEAAAECHEVTQSKKWNTIDEWVVQVRDATIIES